MAYTVPVALAAQQ